MPYAGFYTLALEPTRPTASEADSQTLFRMYLPAGKTIGFIVVEPDGMMDVKAVADFHNVPLELHPGTRYVWYVDDGDIVDPPSDGFVDALASGVKTVVGVVLVGVIHAVPAALHVLLNGDGSYEIELPAQNRDRH